MKLILILFVVVVETLCAAAIIWGLWMLCKRFGRVQFSLRTLMIGVTLVAVALSSISTWRYLSLARIEWLAPSSPVARQLVAKPVVIELDDGFSATYSSKFRPAAELVEVATEDQRSGQQTWSGLTTLHHLHTITVQSSHESRLEETLAALAEADAPKKGWFAIRGVVEDREGRPVADAMVDLMGPYVYINHCQTRDDGTFTMPIQAPPGRGYYLRIRYGGNQRMNTARFTLSDDNRERVMRIHVW